MRHTQKRQAVSTAVFFAETDGKQNIGSTRSNAYKGAFKQG
jgi:hypothetical protein